MELDIDERGDRVAVLRLTGRLDLVSAARVRRAVEDVVAGGRPAVVADLEGVTFVDSSGLGALIAGLKVARRGGGELRIAAVGEQVRTVLSLTRLDRVLRAYGSVDEALEGL